MPIKTLDNIFEKDRNNPEFLEAYLEEKAKLENRSVSNYIVTLIQKNIANSSPPKEDGDFLANLLKFN